MSRNTCLAVLLFSVPTTALSSCPLVLFYSVFILLLKTRNKLIDVSKSSIFLYKLLIYSAFIVFFYMFSTFSSDTVSRYDSQAMVRLTDDHPVKTIASLIVWALASPMLRLSLISYLATVIIAGILTSFT